MTNAARYLRAVCRPLNHARSKPAWPPLVARLSTAPTKNAVLVKTAKMHKVILGAVAFGTGAAILLGAESPSFISAESLTDSSPLIAAPITPPGLPVAADTSYPPTMTIYDKELPVVTVFGDDTSDLGKPRLVILGSGWGATSLLKDLEPNGYYTVVISPTNYFLFTPLLPEATTGTVEARSLLESIRYICRTPRAHFCEAEAYDVHLKEKVVEVVGEDGRHFLVPYDRLVVAVGAQNNTLGVPGVQEHTRFLKTIADARRLRVELMTNFELAALPTTSELERKRLLSFVIAGGGPTGVEYASELYDFLHEDLINYFPDILEKDVSVTIIQSADHILNTFSMAISAIAEEKLRKHKINVITNARVTEVDSAAITYRKKNVPKGEPNTFVLPFGICLWSTGIGMRDFTRRLVGKLQQQENTRALEVDSRLKLKGDPNIYAIGDCATIENPRMLEIVKERFQKAGMDRLTYQQFQSVIGSIVDQYPQTAVHLSKLRSLFDTYDIDKNNVLDLDEITKLLDDVDKKLTSLPATAQVARQQGAYLARKFNSLAFTPSDLRPVVEQTLPPFYYKHLGNFSYIGEKTAVIDLGEGRTGGGFGVFLLWRGAYLARQVSMRTRVLLAFDWIKSKLFGRDVSRF
ncbi:uncharacterized protein SPPG_04802 [Spizellomyces punctatus DAOM BR117]|uniref:EF-hand domain-containing protein n=1 Tax=Spizellomyces punctatus (strain DAOM BR117) TaxID=645134 RepID=A0A0L0HG64_SPIPD|nr:uncharacterized protein SPPG_04802 [Spizellomyces punctatus DAOM BR117]KND00486.1 hypothetical protein SPPG_04802 [Spizellomyces punctatus DAOM BR117]|eukprot:XP_016608525.1 hypothetical protein SPPG_04802 [Spizellomyces punctatus DAOM BR117]